MIDPNGGTTTYTYNNLGEESTMILPGQTAPTTYTYDENGNELSVTDQLGDKTVYTYNNMGWQVDRDGLSQRQHGRDDDIQLRLRWRPDRRDRRPLAHDFVRLRRDGRPDHRDRPDRRRDHDLRLRPGRQNDVSDRPR